MLQADEGGAGGQLLVYDGLQQQEEVEQVHRGVELLADPSYNYQYYISDVTGIQRVTLLWVMNVDCFLQDIGTNCKPHSTDCKPHNKSSTHKDILYSLNISRELKFFDLTRKFYP